MKKNSTFDMVCVSVLLICILYADSMLFKFVIDRVESVKGIGNYAFIIALIIYIVFGFFAVRGATNDYKQDLKIIKRLEKENKKYKNLIYDVFRKINDDNYDKALEEDRFEELKNFAIPLGFEELINDAFEEIKGKSKAEDLS